VPEGADGGSSEASARLVHPEGPFLPAREIGSNISDASACRDRSCAFARGTPSAKRIRRD